MLKQLFKDLWQTQVEHPFAGLNTHAYFLKCNEGNVLFYNTSHSEDIQEIAQLGGIKYQYLSHRDETGASLQKLKEQFGSALCCDVKEKPFITPSCPVDITFSKRVSHFSGIEVIPTPGHTEGSLSFLYQSPPGLAYLFTGDTFFQSNGRWETIYFSHAGGSSEALIESLLIYRELNPDVVISSASSEGSLSFVELTRKEWIEAIDHNIDKLNT